MAKKQPENNDDLFELIKKLSAPVTGFLGAITLAYNFYKLWQGDQATVTYFLAGGGLVLLIVAMIFVITRTKIIPLAVYPWSPFKKPYYSPFIRNIAKGGIGLVIILSIGGILLLIQHREEQKKYLAELEQKLVVLIAAFEGPEEVYGLRNQIIENLNADFSSKENVEIVLIDEIITLTKGSNYARQLGGDYFADIVIWGWYRPTDNPNVTIHIENLSPAQLLPLKESETFQPVTTISELESFSFQQQSGNETSALILFLTGFIEYESENYETAIQYFDNSLATLPESPSLFENRSEIYFYRGNSNLYLTNYESAIQDYDQAIQLNPQFAEAYNNRGNTYQNQGKYKRAIQDFDQAIQLNPQLAVAYNNRGNAYQNLGKYERAIQDYDQAIQLNPQFAEAYSNRGSAHQYLGEYERAIQDYDQAILINPQDALASYNRGNAYQDLGEYESAIQDFDQAIQLNPQFGEAYSNRGTAYYNLEEYERAIQDYDQAILINPQDAKIYYNRGNIYYYLGEYERAIQDDDQAIQLNPQYGEAYSNRGNAHQYLGEYERAIQDYDQAILINPQDALAYNNRGVAYQTLGKTAEAEADFAKSKELTGQGAP